MLHQRILRLPLLLAALLSLSLAAPARAAGEVQAIENLNQALLETMQEGADLGFDGRAAKLDPVLTELFDFRSMVQIGLQRYWKDMPETDREAVTEAFRQMSIATFASRFDSFGGENFAIDGTKPGPRSLTLVTTRITRPGKDDVSLTYVLKPAGESAQVIDVLAQGRYSELARQRAEMSSVYARSGASGLVESLTQKAAELAAE